MMEGESRETGLEVQGMAYAHGARRSATMVVVLLLSSSATARGDRAEASLHAHAVGGVAMVSDQATNETAVAPLVGVAARASYARSDWFQYDAQLTIASTSAASFDAGSFRFNDEAANDVPFQLTTRLVRFDLGATFRFGVKVIPTVRVAVGIDARFRGAPVVSLGGSEQEADGRHGDIATDLVGTGAVGLDYRVGPRLIAGASIGGSLAVPFGGPDWRTVEASAHVAYYFYPLWFD